jgi:hypothetical protein
MSSNLHDVGFIPGGASLKYSSPLTFTFKTNNEVPAMIEEWCRRTGRSLDDLARADHVFVVDKNPNGKYQVDFVKCRNRESIIAWCHAQFGRPGKDGRWFLIPRESYNPRMIIRDEDAVVLLRMVWE